MNIRPTAARTFAFAGAALAAPLMVVAHFLWPVPHPYTLVISVLGCGLAALSAFAFARLLLPATRNLPSKRPAIWRGAVAGLLSFIVSNVILWLIYFLFFFIDTSGVPAATNEKILFALMLTGLATLWFGWLSAVLGAAVGWFNVVAT